MVGGADSIDDMAALRLGGMGRVFDHAYAPSNDSARAAPRRDASSVRLPGRLARHLA